MYPMRLNGVVRGEPSLVQLFLHSTTFVNIYTTVHLRTALRGWLLGAFTELRKATINFVVSALPHGATRLPLDGFSRNLIFAYFSEIAGKIQVSLKSDVNNGFFT